MESGAFLVQQSDDSDPDQYVMTAYIPILFHSHWLRLLSVSQKMCIIMLVDSLVPRPSEHSPPKSREKSINNIFNSYLLDHYKLQTAV